MNKRNYILLPIVLSCLCSCDRVKEHGKEIKNQVKFKFNQTVKDAVDIVVPQFDSYTPDSKYNRKRFKDFLQVEITPDIKNIYCYGDMIGIDALFQFSFNCDTATANRIIALHQLSMDTSSGSFSGGFPHEFDWWHTNKLMHIRPYMRKGDHEYYQYFWYDTIERKAYYLDFDM